VASRSGGRARLVALWNCALWNTGCMTTETLILGVFWLITAVGAVGVVAAFVSTVRAGGKRY